VQLQGLVQRPAVHGTPLQQSALTMHCCPYRAHVVASASGMPASGGEPPDELPPDELPLSGGGPASEGGLHGAQ
jgi:hypothetical protein